MRPHFSRSLCENCSRFLDIIILLFTNYRRLSPRRMSTIFRLLFDSSRRPIIIRHLRLGRRNFLFFSRTRRRERTKKNEKTDKRRTDRKMGNESFYGYGTAWKIMEENMFLLKLGTYLPTQFASSKHISLICRNIDVSPI